MEAVHREALVPQLVREVVAAAAEATEDVRELMMLALSVASVALIVMVKRTLAATMLSEMSDVSLPVWVATFETMDACAVAS